MKIAVIGSREFRYSDFVRNEVYRYFKHAIFPLAVFDDGPPVVFLSGGARGVDTWAEEEIDQLNKQNASSKILQIVKDVKYPDKTDFDKIPYHAKVERYYARNRQIVEQSDILLVFWDGKSGGTKQGIEYAIQLGKVLNIYIR